LLPVKKEQEAILRFVFDDIHIKRLTTIIVLCLSDVKKQNISDNKLISAASAAEKTTPLKISTVISEKKEH